MTRFSLFLFGFWIALSTLPAQEPPDTEEEFERQYKWRIRQEYLFGTYIPKDLTDAFIQLNRLIDEESKAKFRSMSEDQVVHKLFFSFGRWIVHNWGFYGGSRLSHFLRGLGVYHPEDQAALIMIAYHRNLNRKPLDIKGLVEHFQQKREAERLERLKKGTILYQEVRKRPPPDSLKN